MDFRRIFIIAAAVFVFAACGWTAILRADPPPASEQPRPPAQKETGEAAAEKSAGQEDGEYELQRTLIDTIDHVERNYVKGISRRELIEAAIRGVLEKLDPYSTYISPEDIDRFRADVENEYCGIGIQIDVEDGRLLVISPLPGTPAQRAGILAGDHIVAIDGRTTENITIDAAVLRLKGKEGSKVELSVLHADEEEPVDVSVVRGRIQIQTVLADSRDEKNDWDYMLDKKHRIGYVRVTIFGRETAKELREALDKLKRQDLKALILDLRFNPGGLLNSAIEVSDMFVDKGLIVSTSGRNVKERKWEARVSGTFSGFPMAVLVNRITASAGEIVAACLQDHHRAVIMGERTWGKGSVQNVISLEHGLAALKLTTASYLRPSGKNIHRFPDSKDEDTWGVVPDAGFALENSPAEMIALAKARSKRDNRKKEQKTDAEEEHKNADPLMKMALDYLVGELDKSNQKGNDSSNKEVRKILTEGNKGNEGTEQVKP